MENLSPKSCDGQTLLPEKGMTFLLNPNYHKKNLYLKEAATFCTLVEDVLFGSHRPVKKISHVVVKNVFEVGKQVFQNLNKNLPIQIDFWIEKTKQRVTASVSAELFQKAFIPA